jgi:2-dehydro-3-deoxyphosphogluconate aldolase / (4S)-4-hydroxy-2-oxoglutarate aldolase
MSSPLDPLGIVPVIPVVVIEDVAHAVPLARALVAGGLPAIELTLRTPVAMEAAKAIATEVPEIALGIGTVNTPALAEAAIAAGARFLVSPGATPDLLAALGGTEVPWLVGTSTPSEVMAVLEAGVTQMKFFPAEAAGGIPMLTSINGPLPEARFCPTGGIRQETAADYLALPNVGCVGGTWLTPADALAAGDWDRVTGLAARAAALG